MSNSNDDMQDRYAVGIHFQLIVIGTTVFLLSLFWLTALPHTNTWEEGISVVAPRVLIALQLLGCYIAFTVVVVTHRYFGKNICDNKKRA